MPACAHTVMCSTKSASSVARSPRPDLSKSTRRTLRPVCLARHRVEQPGVAGVCHVPYPAGEKSRAARRPLNRFEYWRRNRVMQTAEGHGDGIYLGPGDRARA
jgi:hypothetical protein